MYQNQKTTAVRQTASRLFLLFLSITLLAACSVSNQNTGEIDPDNIVAAFVGDLSASATASGQIEPLRRAGLSAGIPGVVEEVHVRVGDEVASGDILVILDTADLELTLAAAEQALAIKQADLAALQKPAGAFELAAAEADVASAKARLDDLLDGPSASEITVTEASVREANASIFSASARKRMLS